MKLSVFLPVSLLILGLAPSASAQQSDKPAPPGKMHIKVIGGVKQQGIFEARVGITVLEALINAGGFTEDAARKAVIVHAGIATTPTAVTEVDLVKLFNGDLTQNFRLYPGDIIMVSRWEEICVRIEGGVVRPGEVRLEISPKLSWALLEAGDICSGARPERLTICRYDDHGREVKIAVDIKAGLIPEMLLKDGDVVEVPGVCNEPRTPRFDYRRFFRFHYMLDDRIPTAPNPPRV